MARRVLVIVGLGLLGILAAASIGYASYLVSRDEVGLPVTKLEPSPTELAPPAANRTTSTRTGTNEDRGSTTTRTTRTGDDRATTTVETGDDGSGRGRGRGRGGDDDSSGSGSGGSGSDNSGSGSDNSGSGSGSSGSGGSDFDDD